MALQKQPAPRVYTWVDFTPLLDTSAYAQNDILWVPQIVSNAAWKADQIMKLEQLIYLDKDDQSAMDVVLYFFDSASASLGGAFNTAFAPSDANAALVTTKYTVGNASFVDVGGAKQAIVQPGVWVKPVAGTRDLYLGATYTNAVTPTFTASGTFIRMCFSS
jgi:hypothetical protein